MKRYLSLLVSVVCACSLIACPCHAETKAASTHDCCPSQDESFASCACEQKISAPKLSAAPRNFLIQTDLIVSTPVAVVGFAQRIRSVSGRGAARSIPFYALFPRTQQAPPITIE